MDYLNSLEQAITYIEQNLSTVTAQDVAKQVGYSYYHFTRLFTALLGEPVGSYIKKRRLANAAKQLIYSDIRIITIAMESGFESPEAFSRAFKQIYKVSPIQYRVNRLDTIIGAKKELHPNLLNHIALNVTTQPKIVTIPPVKLAGMRGNTTLQDNVIPALWDDFRKLLPSIPNIPPNAKAYGICEACEEGQMFFTMNNKVTFSEVAAIEVDSFEGLPKCIVQKTLPGGKYAVFTHRGSIDNLRITYNYIWSTWLFNSKEQLDTREDFELYDHRFLGRFHPESEIDIYIPIL